MQRAIVDMGSAEVAARFTQRGTGLFAKTLQLGGIQLGTLWFKKRDGLVNIAFDFQKVPDRRSRQLGYGHAREVSGVESQFFHGCSPHWYARAKVECRETRRSNASISGIR